MKKAYLVPFSPKSLDNKFFEPSQDPEVTTVIMQHMRDYFRERGIQVDTFDRWGGKSPDKDDVLIVFDHPPVGWWKYLFAIRNFLFRKSGFPLKDRHLGRYLHAFNQKILFHWESPVNWPWMFSQTKSILKHYTAAYSIPNAHGAKSFYYPQRWDAIFEDDWKRTDRKFLVMMNSIRTAKGYRSKELYTERACALEALARLGDIDLYGEFWKGKHGDFMATIYKGYAKDKADTMSRYTFAIAFENAVWPGYITEKMFECFMVGTIPVYLGAPDVTDHVPAECFIDMRKFRDYEELHRFLRSLTPKDITRYRTAARAFVESSAFHKYTKQGFAEFLYKAVTVL